MKKTTANSNTVSTYQVSSVQLVIDKKLEAVNKAQLNPGVGKLFSRRATLTIQEWSRASAYNLVQLHAKKEIALA